MVSSDPAHSLADGLECPVGSKTQPTAVAGIENLWALEMDAPTLLEEFKDKYQEVITEIAARGTYLDRDDISRFLGLSLPGLDEVMAILEIADIIKNGSYDLVILDTAPTGHTLRLLSMPEQMLKWIHVFDLMQEKHRYLVRRFTGRYRADQADAFLHMMVGDMKRVRRLLQSQTTEFVPVVVPEPMVTRETERLLAALQRFAIPVKTLVVNRVEDSRDPCAFCVSRRKGQTASLALLQEKFAAYKLVRVPAWPREVRGTQALYQFGRILFGEAQSFDGWPGPGLVRDGCALSQGTLPELLEKDRKVLFFAGKGGVGKTTLAAATALRLAGSHPSKKILIYSVDPAHSLSDSFECALGPRVTPIPGVKNLYGMEIDPTEAFRAYRETYRTGVDRAFEQLQGKDTRVAFDREVVREIFDLAPPGLEEIMALEELAELVEKRSYDLYVLDPAPTGHLIRFLELPGIMKDWLHALFRILLKYKNIFHLNEMSGLIHRLLESSKKAQKIRELLVDPKATELVAVTTPEAMSVLEVKRLLSTLPALQIRSQQLVVNKVLPPTACGFCACKSAEEHTHLQELYALEPRLALLPLLPHEISGLESLNQFSRIMFGGAGN